MRVKDSEMSMRWNKRSLVNAGDISPEIANRWMQTEDEKNVISIRLKWREIIIK